MVNVSSVAALYPHASLMAYGMSKIGLERLTVDAASQLAASNIAVNCFRIDIAVASEGFVANTPGVDHSNWEPSEVAAEGIVWMVRQPPATRAGGNPCSPFAGGRGHASRVPVPQATAPPLSSTTAWRRSATPASRSRIPTIRDIPDDPEGRGDRRDGQTERRRRSGDRRRTEGLVDEERLGRWMDTQDLPGAGEAVASRFISGGASNEIFEITRGDFRAMFVARPGWCRRAATRPCFGSTGCSRR